MWSIWFWSLSRPRVALVCGLKSLEFPLEDEDSMGQPSYTSFASHDLKLRECTDNVDAKISRRKFASQRTRSVKEGTARHGRVNEDSEVTPTFFTEGCIQDDNACGSFCIRVSFIWSTFWALCSEDGRYGEFAGQPRVNPFSQKVVLACHFSGLGQDRKCRTAWLPWCRIRPLMPSLDLWWSPMLFSSEPERKVGMSFPSTPTYPNSWTNKICDTMFVFLVKSCWYTSFLETLFVVAATRHWFRDEYIAWSAWSGDVPCISCLRFAKQKSWRWFSHVAIHQFLESIGDIYKDFFLCSFV